MRRRHEPSFIYSSIDFNKPISYTRFMARTSFSGDRNMSDQKAMNEQRRADVRALVELAVPIDQALERLSKYPYDFLGEPIRVRSEHIGKAATEFLEGKITARELAAWADRLEIQDDVKADGKTDQETDEIINAIFAFANPELSGCSLEDTATFVRSIMLKDSVAGGWLT
jgi:hypothetical protein